MLSTRVNNESRRESCIECDPRLSARLFEQKSPAKSLAQSLAETLGESFDETVDETFRAKKSRRESRVGLYASCTV